MTRKTGYYRVKINGFPAIGEYFPHIDEWMLTNQEGTFKDEYFSKIDEEHRIDVKF